MTEKNTCGWCGLPFKFEGAVSNPEAIKICQCRSPQPKPLGVTTKVGPELLPCPFCGSRDVCVVYEGISPKAVECKSCGASGPTNTFLIPGWNERFALPPVAPTEAREDKWEKLKTFLHETEKARGWSEKDYHSALFEVAKKMMELEAQQ